jgi:hypothetical protein
MFRELGMLQEEDVVVGAGGGDRVPYALKRGLEVSRLDLDLEHAEVIGLTDRGIR